MATYKTIQGDTWDIISFRVYGDEHYIDRLIAANAAHRGVVLFPAGIVLDVPEIETDAVSNEDLPPWKRGGGQ